MYVLLRTLELSPEPKQGGTKTTAKECRVSFWGNENVLEVTVVIIQLCGYTKNKWILQFTWMNFVVYELYLHKALIPHPPIYILYGLHEPA